MNTTPASTTRARVLFIRGPARRAAVALQLLAAASHLGFHWAGGGRTVLAAEERAAAEKTVHRCKPGPWGELEYYYTFLEPPEDLYASWPAPDAETTWRFVDYPPERIRQLFISAGLPVPHLNALLDEARWSSAGSTISVRPPAEVLEGMTPGMRATIYAVLRRWGVNQYHFFPAYIDNGNVPGWFAHTDIPGDMISRIEKLSYRHNKGLRFSDFEHLLAEVGDQAERQRLTAKIQGRMRSIILRIRLDERADLAALEDYWTVGAKHKDALPVLRSIVLTRGVERLDIVHLLPPTARRLLYTYPSVDWGVHGDYPDCHWTAVNFFRHLPRERFLDEKAIAAELKSQLSSVAPPYQYGDILVLRKSNGTGSGHFALHSAVYIADDIVYSKNGHGRGDPWVLMRMDDMLGRFVGLHPLSMVAFRRR